MDPSELVSPAATATPVDPAAAAPAPEEAPSQESALPDEVLRLPGMMALIAGAPPALSVRLKDKETRDDVKLIKENQEALQSAGFGLYRSLSGEFGVIFNQLFVHPQDILAADKMGKLEEIAPPSDAISHAIGKSGLDNPVLKPGSRPTGFAGQKSLTAPQSGSGALPQPGISASPAGAGVENRAQTARLKNMVPGGPTTGPKPGAGRILNSILKPVV